MKFETYIFGINTVFFAVVAPGYWFITGDPTGTAALTMTTLLTALVTFYLGFHASKMEPRPEDRKEGEIAEGAGELGFFPPYRLVAALGRPDRRGRLLRPGVRRVVAARHRHRPRIGHGQRLGLRVLPRRARSLTATRAPGGGAAHVGSATAYVFDSWASRCYL